MNIFSLIIFILWIASNLVALPILFGIMSDGNSYFFLPFELWRRLRLKFSSTISGILLVFFCVWFCLDIFFNLLFIFISIVVITLIGICHFIKGGRP